MYCCELKHKSGELTRELVDGWLSGEAHRNSDYQRQYRTAIRQFAIHLLENGMKAYVSPVYRPEVLPVDETFKSCLKDSIKGLVESKRARGYKYGPLNEYGILKRVDSFCVSEGLQKDELPRWIVEKWSEKINDEGAKSRANRIVVIRQLALFMISHGKKAYVAESIPYPHNPFPYIPDEKEMAALFVEIDLQKNKHP